MLLPFVTEKVAEMVVEGADVLAALRIRP